MKLVKILSVALVAICALSLAACKENGPTLKDANGNVYESVRIGNQIWQASNMNEESPHSWCYDNDPSNCEKYGRLYTWQDAKKVCPSGWHLPTREEFETLLKELGAEWIESKVEDCKYCEKNYLQLYGTGKVRSKKWKSVMLGNGTDDYGLSVLPAGARDYSLGKFVSLGFHARWWGATEEDKDYAYPLLVLDGSAGLFFDSKESGNSVRCLMD